jgi:hypothetical protein
MDNPHLIDDGEISPFATDLNVILDHMDTGYGMPTAVRDYVYALRDLQFAHNECSYDSLDIRAFRQVEARIAKAFKRLAQSHRATSDDLKGWMT